MEPLHDALLFMTAKLSPDDIKDPRRILFGRCYAWAHKGRQAEPISAPNPTTLTNALEVATDEDRLKYAEDCAREILPLTDLADAIYFRRVVLSKETSAAIRFQKQRDHSVHTVHNYLLGWYFFSNSPQLRDEFRAALTARKGPVTDDDPFILSFSEVWCYVSLLHDVGYLFEGDTHSYNAKHWWTSIVWATAAVALHNVQQNQDWLGWKSKLNLSEDPLAYLGILVDILQEWDRHSVRRLPSIASDRRRINSRDVSIGISSEGKIEIEYGCRDGTASARQVEMSEALNAALVGWDRLITFSFRNK